MGKELPYLFNISFNVLEQHCNLNFLNTYAAHELELHIFCQRMALLESDMEVKPTHLSGSGWVPWSRGNGLKILMRAFAMVK